MLKNYIFLVISLVSIWNFNTTNSFLKSKKSSSFAPTKEQHWVDSVYRKMTFNERVGQLFMVAAYSNKDEKHYVSIEKLITEYHIGGLIFFQGGPVRQAILTNRYQSNAKIPLLIGIDAEWGLSMRLDSTYKYPWNMTLGAIKDTSLIAKMGHQMADQSKRLGINFTFSPVVDINTNPNNPIIGNRSFGETKENVTEKAMAYMNGLQKNGVFATAKHFPGHGDTATDSHYTLPSVLFSKERIDSVEIYPYKKLIEKGLASIMVAHLNIPSLEPEQNLPSSLSPKVVTDVLKNKLKFEGLIFTDALNMKGASNFKQPGDIDLAAFLAGNDVLLFAEDVPKAVQKFKDAYKKKKLTESRLAYSVKKILAYKYRAGLKIFNPIDIDNLYQDLNKTEYDALSQKLFENAITTLQNKDNIIPVTSLKSEKIAYVKIGDASNDVFLDYLNDYTLVEDISASSIDSILSKLQKYTKVIIGFHKPDNIWKKNDPTTEEIRWINSISKQKPTILTFFTRPYSLPSTLDYSTIEGLIMAYQNNAFTHKIVPDVIFGSTSSIGTLPVSVIDIFKANTGLKTNEIKRLGFNNPQNVGINEDKLAAIDSIILKAIDEKMTPGAQIVIARRGNVVYQKSFGTHTYTDTTRVKNTDLYDVASLTKVLATLPALMQIYDKGAITLNTPLKEMLPVFKGSNKQNKTLLEMLTHQAGFQAWEAFYLKTLDKSKKPNPRYYNNILSKEFPIKVAENLYLRHDFKDTIINAIVKSKLLPTNDYKYSDFSFILLKEYIEMQTKNTLDKLVEENFYSQMGMNYTTYNPLEKFSKNQIIPTEIDTYYRYQTIHGTVHDMAAAMQGGVSGHAGLFSNALDVAKMMQMYLQNGVYGTNRFFSEKTMKDFNTCYFCDKSNRRGVGFDKPQLGNAGPTCGCVSMTSFGHTGFTGTMAWADPDKEIVYVFLSNRTYPNSNAINKLSRANIRENIQKIIYESIID